MHALEWIEREGRFRRQVCASELRKILGRPLRTCTWCGEQVAGRRRQWCSRECVESFQIRIPSIAARHVKRRDRGVCFNCDRDCLAMERLLHGLRTRGGSFGNSFGWSKEVWRPIAEELKRHWGAIGFDVRGWTRLWQADHIIPVCQGGGLCDPSGYRTLCIPCHKAESAWLARERASGRA